VPPWQQRQQVFAKPSQCWRAGSSEPLHSPELLHEEAGPGSCSSLPLPKHSTQRAAGQESMRLAAAASTASPWPPPEEAIPQPRPQPARRPRSKTARSTACQTGTSSCQAQVQSLVASEKDDSSKSPGSGARRDGSGLDKDQEQAAASDECLVCGLLLPASVRFCSRCGQRRGCPAAQDQARGDPFKGCGLSRSAAAEASVLAEVHRRPDLGEGWPMLRAPRLTAGGWSAEVDIKGSDTPEEEVPRIPLDEYEAALLANPGNEVFLDWNLHERSTWSPGSLSSESSERLSLGRPWEA